MSLRGFELVRPVGKGGMGVLWLASSKAHGDVVLKCLPERSVHDERMRTMFRDEAALAIRLRHPNIVHTYSAHETGPFLFYAMEHLDGLDLSRLFMHLSDRGRRLPLDVSLTLAHRLARALGYAHHLRNDDGTPAGIVHRDISPQNIFVTRKGQVKLLDFGVARSRGKTHQTLDGAIKGKLHYLAPEQARLEPCDHRADIFALGIVLWESVAGRRLFDHDDNASLFDAIDQCRIPPIEGAPRALNDLLQTMLGRSHHSRPPSMRGVENRLAGILVGEGAPLDESHVASFFEGTFPLRTATHAAPRARGA